MPGRTASRYSWLDHGLSPAERARRAPLTGACRTGRWTGGGRGAHGRGRSGRGRRTLVAEGRRGGREGRGTRAGRRSPLPADSPPAAGGGSSPDTPGGGGGAGGAWG